MSDGETMPAAIMPEAPGSAPALPEEALRIAAGYAFGGPALDPGALLRDGACLPDAQIRVPPAMLNRHGPVAGATGTGRTKTLQLLTEQLSAQGVPVSTICPRSATSTGRSWSSSSTRPICCSSARPGSSWRRSPGPSGSFARRGSGCSS